MLFTNKLTFASFSIVTGLATIVTVIDTYVPATLVLFAGVVTITELIVGGVACTEMVPTVALTKTSNAIVNGPITRFMGGTYSTPEVVHEHY